jgi:hypothetical protein
MPVQVNKISLSGSPEEIGYQHGKTLADPIQRRRFHPGKEETRHTGRAGLYRHLSHSRDGLGKKNYEGEER